MIRFRHYGGDVRSSSHVATLALLGGLTASAGACAEESAIRTAADAFGERVGTEQLGLYNESQVRGFDLQASGAYRIGDAYFSRAAPLNDPVLAGVGVRVGVNAARLAYPAPSGVVTYRLRSAGSIDVLSLTAGLRDFGTRVVEINGAMRTADMETGVAGGIVWRPDSRWTSGAEGRGFDAGLVVERKVLGGAVTAFAQVYDRRYDGDDAVQVGKAGLPPEESGRHNYSPAWARVDATSYNVGALYQGRFGPWSVDASAFRSIYDARREDFTIVRTWGEAAAEVTTYVGGPRTNISDAAEGRVARVFAHGRVSHLLSGSLRARRSAVELTSSLSVPHGLVELETRPVGVGEPAWSGGRGRDLVEQVTASLGYGFAVGEQLQVRTGLHRTRYEKAVLSPAGDSSRDVDVRTFSNVSAVLGVSSRLSLFGSWVTGLEESGVAPQNAANRNEVLAPVKAEQVELGVSYKVNQQLTLLAAAFEITKPTMGLRSDNTFGDVGEVTHRGVEASLAGRIGPSTRVVLGAAVFEPRLKGALVAADVLGDRPVGVSPVLANLSLEHRISAAWTVDGHLVYQGGRWVDARNTLKTPDIATLNLGVRRNFDLQGRRVQLRVLASNVTGETAWLSSASGLLSPVSPRTVRALLTVTLERSRPE